MKQGVCSRVPIITIISRRRFVTVSLLILFRLRNVLVIRLSYCFFCFFFVVVEYQYCDFSSVICVPRHTFPGKAVINVVAN